jgi:hypothetical protein
MSVAALLLFFAATSQLLFDDVYQLPAGEWRYVPVTLNQPPVLVECSFSVISGNSTARVTLVNREGLDQLKQGDREPLGSGKFQREGGFSRLVIVPDEYAVVLENGTGGPAAVRFRVSLDFSARAGPQVRYLSPERRFAVIVISATVFLGIVFYSARKLRRAMR